MDLSEKANHLIQGTGAEKARGFEELKHSAWLRVGSMRALWRNTAGEVMRGQSLCHTKDRSCHSKEFGFFPFRHKESIEGF